MNPSPAEACRRLEAALFATPGGMSERDLARLLPEGFALEPLLQALQDGYRSRGVNLVRAGRQWSFVTAPDLAPWLAESRRTERKLSRAAAETLAIIAYHQPVTRTEIETIRGVQIARGTLDALFEQGWVATRGRRDSPGRPVLWVTTDAFLRHFGLESLRDLPGLDDLRAAGLLDKDVAPAGEGEPPMHEPARDPAD